MTKCWVRGVNMWVPLSRYLSLIRSVCQAARKIYFYCWCSFLHRNVTGWARYEMFYYYTIRRSQLSPLLVLQRIILGSFKAGLVKSDIPSLNRNRHFNSDGQKRLKNATCRQDNKFCFAIKNGYLWTGHNLPLRTSCLISKRNNFSVLCCNNRRLRVVPIFPQG